MLLRLYYKMEKDYWVPGDPAPQSRRKAGEPEGMATKGGHDIVRWVAREIITSYGYPAEWMGGRMQFSTWTGGSSMAVMHLISFLNEFSRPFMFIVAQDHMEDQAFFMKATEKLQELLSQEDAASLGMVTDGDVSRVLIKNRYTGGFGFLPDLPRYQGGAGGTNAGASREKGRHRTGTPQRDPPSRYDDILVRCHSAIRSLDGLHDDDALDELSKVIFTKVHDEKNEIRGRGGPQSRFHASWGGNNEETASCIRALYDDARNMKPRARAGSQGMPGDDPGVFIQPLRLSSDALVKVVQILQEYSLSTFPLDLKGKMFQKVVMPAARSGMGQFFTPDEVVRLAVGMAEPTADDNVLDPFCGSGNFLRRCFEAVESGAHQARGNGSNLAQSTGPRLVGLEKSERMARLATADSMLRGDINIRVMCTDALLSLENYPGLLETDGSTFQGKFSLILTNPPFGSVVDAEGSSSLGDFELLNGRRSTPMEVLGLERSLHFLKPGGRLAIILQDGVLSDNGLQYVRDWIHRHAELVAVVSLPEHTFSPFGAFLRTSLVLLRKRDSDASDAYGPARNVFFARIDDIGYDTTGRPTGTSEVQSVIREFHNAGGW